MFTGFWELLIVLLIILLLFGAKMIPSLTKAIKESIETFKDTAKADSKDEEVKE